MARLRQRNLFQRVRKRKHPFEVGLSPRLIGVDLAELTESDGVKVPRILRNQSLRLGSAYAGKAISTGGGAIALSGARARTKPRSQVTRYESVRKSQLRSKGLKPQRGVSYLPEKDSKVNRWHEKRLNSKSKKPRTPGRIRIGMGSTMMVAGRAVPYLMVGYLAYEMLPERSREGIYETDIGSYSLKDRVGHYTDFGSDVYSGVALGYTFGKGLLGVFA